MNSKFISSGSRTTKTLSRLGRPIHAVINLDNRKERRINLWRKVLRPLFRAMDPNSAGHSEPPRLVQISALLSLRRVTIKIFPTVILVFTS